MRITFNVGKTFSTNILVVYTYMRNGGGVGRKLFSSWSSSVAKF